MNNTLLHYVYDPLCGWCWGAAPLVHAARAALPVRLHAGGMMTGARRQRVTPELRAFVAPHDERIAQLSGQPFGAAYRDGLLRDPLAVFDSEPPTAAILAAEALGGRGLDMLAQLQTAHYVLGLRIADRAVLVELACGIGLPQPAFADELDRQSAGPVQAHVQQTRAFMAASGAQGFPSFVLEGPTGLQRVDASAYLGRPEAFVAALDGLLAQLPATAGASPALCDADGCAL
ncbi:DsbA family protein [Roseateles sp.]|uniref:DsbA family protein n=1 Tax=Roseateles sp. TaxID=1971397 RepID=UPI00326437C3